MRLLQLQDMLEGKPMPAAALRYVDVRDVAAAHVAAAEVPQANGRYLLGYHSTVPPKDISDALQVGASLPSAGFCPPPCTP